MANIYKHMANLYEHMANLYDHMAMSTWLITIW